MRDAYAPFVDTAREHGERQPAPGVYGEDEHPEDRRRIQRVLRERGFAASLAECAALWRDYSDGLSASWLILPPDDERVYAALRSLIPAGARLRWALAFRGERQTAPGVYGPNQGEKPPAVGDLWRPDQTHTYRWNGREWWRLLSRWDRLQESRGGG